VLVQNGAADPRSLEHIADMQHLNHAVVAGLMKAL